MILSYALKWIEYLYQEPIGTNATPGISRANGGCKDGKVE